MTVDLFCKYTSNQCSSEERNIVEEWLEKCTDAELTCLLQPLWDADYDLMPGIVSDELWAVVHKKITLEAGDEISITKKFHTTIQTVWKVAACIAFILVAGYSVLLMREKPVFQANHKTILSKTVDTVTWIMVNNQQKEFKIISLKDHSEVALYPFSSIRYASDFNSKERNVYLTGKATFTIAKNKSKPFTVFTDEIATTAVGTRFQVNGDLASGIISVKLFEGIVKIRSTQRSIPGWENGKLLYPGEEVRFENGKAIAKLNNTTDKPKIIPGIEPINNKSFGDEIVFSNTPLAEVFETMEKLYGIKINYRKKDVAGMHLTTTINRKDQPSSILNAIVEMNALNFQKMEEGFKITSVNDNKQ